MAITCDISDPILSINITRALNSQHNFTVTVHGRLSQGLSVGSVVNFSGDCGAFAGKIQGVKYDKTRNVTTLSGCDLMSWELAEARIELTTAQDVQTTLNAIASQIDSRINCPAIPCYGQGLYSGNKLQFVQRIADSFGLYYIADDAGLTYYPSLTTTDKNEALSAWNESDDYGGKINKIYIAKTVNLPSYERMDIANGTSNEETLEMLENPNAEDSGFSKSAYIDPWLKTLVTISVPVAYIVWNKAVSIGEKKQVQFVSTTDSAADPPWILELWDLDPGTPEAPNAQAVKLAEIDRRTGHDLWQSSGAELARYARIGRWMPISGSQPVKDYPHYDGVRVTILAWQEVTRGGVQAYNYEHASQLSGKPDYNIISETMLPDQAQLISSGIPARLLDIDRTDFIRNAEIPYISAFNLLNKSTGADIDRIDQITWSMAPGRFTTSIQGEGT